MKLLIPLAFFLSACGPTPDDEADRVHKLMRECYETLEYHPHPIPCDQGLAAYRNLDISRVDEWKLVTIRLDMAAIAERMDDP